MQQKEKMSFLIRDLSLNENVYGIPSNIFQSIFLSEIDISKYTQNNIFVNYLIENHDIDRKNIILGNGTEDLLLRFFYVYLKQYDTILLADICWEHYFVLAKRVKANCVVFPLEKKENQYIFNEDTIIEKARRSKPQMIIINSPNNPTGNVMSYEQLEKILKNCSNSIILFDECYKGFNKKVSYSEQQVLVNKYNNVVFLNSLSKYFALAAIRIGFAVASTMIIKTYELIKSRWDVSPIDQLIAREAMRNEQFFICNAIKIRKARDWFIEQIRNNTEVQIFDSEANFVYLKHNKINRIYEKILEGGYLVKCGHEYIRITIGEEKDMVSIYNIIFRFLNDR